MAAKSHAVTLSWDANHSFVQTIPVGHASFLLVTWESAWLATVV